MKYNMHNTVIANGDVDMSDDINQNQILMGASDVCAILDIKESTLRKYALILQDAGYHFHTNDKGQRGYFDRDVTVLRRFLEIKKASDMTLEQSANAVMAWVEQSGVSLRVIEKNKEDERYNADIKELKEMVSNQNELLKALMTQMDQQQKYIDDSLKKRDEVLMQSLKESMETRKLIAAAQEEEKKKGFWKRLFDRK